MNPLTQILAALCAALALVAGVFIYLYKDVFDDYSKFRADVDAAQKQAEADAKKQRLLHERIVSDVSNAWSSALAYRERRPVVRVLQPAGCVSEGGTIPAPTSGLDVGTAQQGLGGEILVPVSECSTRLNNCARDAAQLILLQKFVTKRHEASK